MQYNDYELIYMIREDEEALDLYREYEDAKKAKDFQKSDLVRAKLMEKGVF